MSSLCRLARIIAFFSSWLVVAGCAPTPAERSEALPSASSSPLPPPEVASASVSSASSAPEPNPVKKRITLLAGGDVSFGRMIGQILLKEPNRALFSPMADLLQSADVRFVNLEGPISDQGTETVSSENKLVFNGPPASASVLAAAGFDVVSTANNHTWDYGKSAMLETLALLDKAGIAHAGTGPTLADAKKPAIIERSGFRMAILAVTDIWNQGLLSKHPAKDYVAAANAEEIASAVREIRKDPSIDAVVVSYHGGEEYRDDPLPQTRAFAEAAIDAGADVFLGHHPHVAQGITFRQGRPIVYSLGNLLMRMASAHPETEMGLVVKVELEKGATPRIEACPVRIFGIEPIPLGKDPERKLHEGRFFRRLEDLSRRTGSVTMGQPGADGCALVSPRP